MFVYLHGFNSSPHAFKARLLRERLIALGRAAEFAAPVLPHRPLEAVAAVEQLMRGQDSSRVTLVGSSLGGHYATWLAERHGWRAVLINPAVAPHLLLRASLGPQTNHYTGESYELTPQHLAELGDTHVDSITQPRRYLLLVATGDEVLDCRAAVARYRGAACIEHEGGDHGFAEFARYLDRVIGFADA